MYSKKEEEEEERVREREQVLNLRIYYQSKDFTN